jgi:IclR family pca regulon transcriptional regulator
MATQDRTKAVRKKKSGSAAAAAKPASESTLYVQSVEKAMKVLMAFDGSKRQLSLSEICTLTQLDLSAAQRFTFTLTALGYLNKELESRKYELSPRLLDFTYHYLASSDVVNRAAPFLQQLSQMTEEVCNLTVLDGPDIVFVLRIVSRNVLHPNVIVGTRLPAYCTAPGLALLSTLPDDEVDALLDASTLVKHTPKTVIDRRRIKERLAAARANGFVRTEDEYFAADISTAAAITDARGRGIGAINVAMSPARWNPARDEQRFADLVRSTAFAVSAHRRHVA